MHPCGLSDSLAALAGAPNECPRCHTDSRIAHNLCLSCLLHSGAEEAEDPGPDEFEAALDAVAVTDRHWRLGNYEILEEIGRGGMGVIYRARQRHSRRIVAVKRVLSYHADSRETLARFRREAEAAASLDHPNILPIYEVAESEEDVPYFSMKYASGGSLQEVGPALRDDPREVVRLMVKVTRAVQYAHRQGILHRDLKPGNILLDARGEPLVSDFGLAKWLDVSSNLTRTLTIFGTPGYIAPEQAEGRATGLKPTSDIYSLGAILFDLLAGRPPFLGEHALAVIKQAAEKPAPKLRSLVRQADKDLETICARCLEREPTARYRSAGDLAEDLEHWLEGRPIVARPVAPPVRLWRWSKRNPLLSGSVAATLLVAALALVRQVQTGRLAETVRENQLAAHSIAVLPFLDLDTALADSQFANALISSLEKGMARLGPARVAAFLDQAQLSPALGSAEEIRAISRQADTRSVITGTVRRADTKLRISLRLTEASSGEVLLQRVLTLNSSDSPARSVSVLAANELYSVLDGRPRTVERDPAFGNKAASEFLRAGYEFEKRRGKRDFDRALECYERAIEAEPASALARADFSKAALSRYFSSQTSAELLTKAERYGREAIRLNPALPEAHRALSGLLYAKGDISASRQESLEAIELGGLSQGPVQSVANTTQILGRPDLALRWERIAQVIQENPADYEFGMAESWAALGEDLRAETLYRRASTLHPDLPEGWMGLCELRLLRGDFDAARSIYAENLAAFADFPAAKRMAAQVEFFARNWTKAAELCRELAQSDPNGALADRRIPIESVLGRLQQVLSDPAAGEKILTHYLVSATAEVRRAPNSPEALHRLAAGEACLGQCDLALEHLQRSFQHGYLDYWSLRLDPRFDTLHNQPLFAELLDAMAKRVASLRAAAVSPTQMTGNGEIK